MSDLKPCPFCGHRAQVMRTCGIGCIDHLFYIVECVYCWAKTAFCDTEAEAVKDWNRRATNGE